MPDMRLTEEEKKDFSTPSQTPKAPKYPYGLRITLGPDEVEKLNFTRDPDIGSKLNITGEVEVVSVSKEDLEGEGFQITLQITDLYLDDKDKEETPPSTASVIYGG